MNINDQLVKRLAAMDADFAEWDAACPSLGTLANQLHSSMERHIKTGTQLVKRAGAGKDIDAQVAELRAVYRTYEPLLRGLAVNSLRVAEIAKRISAQLDQLNEPK